VLVREWFGSLRDSVKVPGPRTKNANELDGVTRVEICSEPLRPENESRELAVVALSTHSAE
jgi:hypothetical protein